MKANVTTVSSSTQSFCFEIVQWVEKNIYERGPLVISVRSSHSRIFHSFGDVTIIPVETANFALCSALMAIEQWGFFSVPCLLWQGASVYNGHLRGPVTLAPIAERLAVELIWVCSGWDSNAQPPLAGPTLSALIHRAIAAATTFIVHTELKVQLFNAT